MGIKVYDKAPKLYIVTGCHNTATSLVALGLARCGVNIGEHLVPQVFEDWDFMTLNESILTEAGGCWHSPPPEKAILAINANQRIADLVTERQGTPMWAFKDPRTALTGKLYLPHIGNRDAYLFCTFRRPDHLLESLQRKGRQLGTEQHMHRALIDRYNQATLDLARAFCGLDERVG